LHPHRIETFKRSTDPLFVEEVVDIAGPGLEGRYGLVPLNILIENPHRVQVHSSRHVGKLSRAIEGEGQLAPAIIDDRYMILAGHARLAAAKALGLASMPVV
jgi:ParB-like chromosome segregation protein Spo0J